MNSVFSASQLPIVISLEVSRRERRSNDWREDWHTSISALNKYLLSRFSCRYFVILYLSFPCYHRHILLFSTLYYVHVLCGKVPFCIRGKGIRVVKNIFNRIIDEYLRCFAKLGSHIDTAMSWHD